MILQNFSVKLSPTKSQREVPAVFREKGILYGFRSPDQPWIYYLASLFQSHNELLNIWTHLIGMFIVIWSGIKFMIEGVSVISNPLFWPLLSGLVATFLMYSLSTLAHTFQSRSEIAHYVFFMFDYAGIGIYGMASGVLHLIYCSSDEFYSRVEPFFVPGCVLTGVFACAGNCLSKVMFKKPYPKSRILWQAIPILTMYFWINLPIVYRFFSYGLHGDNVYSPGLTSHCKQILCFMIGGFLYASQLPQILFPGKFDILGHSHQLFHVFIIFTNLNQMTGISTDLKHLQPVLDKPRYRYDLISAFKPLLMTMLLQGVVVLTFYLILRRKIHEEESIKPKSSTYAHLKHS